jgi:hypothetical protein
MSEDDRNLLNEIIRQEHDKTYPSMKLDTYFELFSAEQILKSRSYDLDQEQIRSGNMGGGRDGGVDSFYVFVNRRLVRDDTDLSQFKGEKVDIDVLVIQSKHSPGFSEGAFDKFGNFIDHVLRLSAVSSAESAVHPTRLCRTVSHNLQKLPDATSAGSHIFLLRNSGRADSSRH